MREPHTEPVRADWWTTDAACVSKSAAWEQALRDCYLDWELTQPVKDEFRAQIRQRPLSEIRLIECRCSPCSGRRVLRRTNQEGEAFVGIQVVVSGGERFKIHRATPAGDTDSVGGDLAGDLLPASDAAPGTIWGTRRAVMVRAADGDLRLGQVQPAGRASMSAGDWANGASPFGDLLGGQGTGST